MCLICEDFSFILEFFVVLEFGLMVLIVFLIWVFSRLWAPPESSGQLMSRQRQEQELQIISEDCTTKKKVCEI